MSTAFRSRAACAFVALLLGACGPGVSADPLDPPPAPGGCGLARPAFCDGFERPAPGGRGGDLDERLWGVARLSQLTNPSQGANNPLPAAQAAGCDGPRAVAPDGSDYFFCARPGESEALHQSLADGGGIVLHAFHARRPFDFAGRVGTIAFGVDGWAIPGAWFEVWVADGTAPVARAGLPALDALPSAGVGLVFQQCGASADGTGLQSVVLVSDHHVTRTIGPSELDDAGCFATTVGTVNRMEIRLGARSVEVLAAAPDEPAALRRAGLLTGVDLPLERGYVHFETLADDAAKFGGAADETRVWDDLGFDGPFLPLSRASDVPDRLETWTGAGASTQTFWNTAYVLLPTNQQTFHLDGLDLRGADRAFLDLNAFGVTAGGTFRFRLGGGTWREAPGPSSSDDSSDDANAWRDVSISVELGDLVAGANTLELSAGNTSSPVLVANVDLTVVPR